MSRAEKAPKCSTSPSSVCFDFLSCIFEALPSLWAPSRVYGAAAAGGPMLQDVSLGRGEVPGSLGDAEGCRGDEFWGCRGLFAQTQRCALAGPFREGRFAFPVNALVRKGKAEPGCAGHGPSSAHTQPPRAHGNAGCTRLGGACTGAA